jgi:diacylglycerol kinase
LENILKKDYNIRMEKNFRTATTFSESSKHAIKGILTILKNERNFRIQLVIAVGVVALGFLLQLSRIDWIGVSFLIALVLVSEAFNSVIEAVCDTVSKDYRVNIKYAKDVSAGAVLVSSILSIILGMVIFLPYIIPLIKEYV